MPKPPFAFYQCDQAFALSVFRYRKVAISVARIMGPFKWGSTALYRSGELFSAEALLSVSFFTRHRKQWLAARGEAAV